VFVSLDANLVKKGTHTPVTPPLLHLAKGFLALPRSHPATKDCEIAANIRKVHYLCRMKADAESKPARSCRGRKKPLT
jgi:hypothetical protein